MHTLLLLAQQPDNGGAAAAGAGIVGGFVLLWAFLVLLAIAATVFWVWMLVDVVTSHRDPAEKIVWVLVILFTHVLGALIYFFAGREAHGARTAAA